jgi:hypothetical protein
VTLRRILPEHLIGGTPVRAYLVATHALCAPVPRRWKREGWRKPEASSRFLVGG